jgi:hypothetical protein
MLLFFQHRAKEREHHPPSKNMPSTARSRRNTAKKADKKKETRRETYSSPSSSNPWIAHVKQYRALKGCSYAEALQGAKMTYRPSSKETVAGKIHQVYRSNNCGSIETSRREHLVNFTADVVIDNSPQNNVRCILYGALEGETGSYLVGYYNSKYKCIGKYRLLDQGVVDKLIAASEIVPQYPNVPSDAEMAKMNTKRSDLLFGVKNHIPLDGVLIKRENFLWYHPES